MKLSTIYIIVKDIEKSTEFYRKLLQEEPLYNNDDRWVQFSNFIALYNKDYDKKFINDKSSERFNESYIKDFVADKGTLENNIVIFNFEVEDLFVEYKRLKDLEIGKVSDLMYVNVHMPYWYFNIIDPDGNLIEITGKYKQ
ncbi:MAG: VOC family protein [Ruminococcus sp.]|nr:VOC family protein [Ruminococcus sp.]